MSSGDIEVQRMISVVPMTSEHTQTLLPLFREMHAESKYSAQVFEEGVILNIMAGLGRNINGFVTLNDGLPIGFALVTLQGLAFRRAKIAVDLGFFVKASYRHTRAFLLLINAIQEWAKQEGAEALICGITAPHDVHSTKRAYEKLGFVEIGINMQKNL